MRPRDTKLCSRYHNAAPIPDVNRAKAGGKFRVERAISGDREPKAQQVTPPIQFRPIRKRGAIMEQRVVVDKLDISLFQLHGKMEPWIVGEIIKEIECLNMLFG